jgi:hypothetical protein
LEVVVVGPRAGSSSWGDSSISRSLEWVVSLSSWEWWVAAWVLLSMLGGLSMVWYGCKSQGVMGARSHGRGGDACFIGFAGQMWMLSGVCWDSIMLGMDLGFCRRWSCQVEGHSARMPGTID